MGRPSEYKPEYCDTATRVLSDGESLAAVCAELDICRDTLYTWRENNPDFDKAVRKGLQKAQRDWESIGRSGITGQYEKFSAPAWIFTMKNRFREDYKEEKEQKSVSDSIVEKIIDRLVE